MTGICCRRHIFRLYVTLCNQLFIFQKVDTVICSAITVEAVKTINILTDVHNIGGVTAIAFSLVRGFGLPLNVANCDLNLIKILPSFFF
jgi:hypothetical protein